MPRIVHFDLPADDDFIVVIDGNEVMPEEITTTDTERELKITIPQNTQSIEIIGTNIVPEFPIAGLILVASMVTILIITRTRWNQI